MATIHRLKTWPEPFVAMQHQIKTFEIRKNDRDYKVGDFLVLDKWSPVNERYLPEDPEVRMVTYILPEGFGLEEGHIAMAVDRLASKDVARVLLEVAPPRAMPLPGDGDGR